MSDRSFPLALPGLVHVRNRIDVLRPIGAGEALDLEVWAERFAAHRSGATVDLCASVSAGGEEVWRGRVDLPGPRRDGARRCAGGRRRGRRRRPARAAPSAGGSPDDTGRRYARVSGDVNPIHLSGLTAKAFGFKRAIAHGMWVKARALAALEGRLPDALSRRRRASASRCSCPSTVTLATAAVGGGWDVAVRNAHERHRARDRHDPPALSPCRARRAPACGRPVLGVTSAPAARCIVRPRRRPAGDVPPGGRPPAVRRARPAPRGARPASPRSPRAADPPPGDRWRR